jgi:hypothetical protein
MNTQQLVALLKEDFAPGYANLKLLSYVERAQNELFKSDCEQMIFVNRSDPVFPVPLLSTADGTLNYVPSASNLVDSVGTAISLTVNGYDVSVRKINRVFIEESHDSFMYPGRFQGRDFSWCGVNPNWGQFSNTEFSEVPVMSYERSGITGAGFTFAENPGTSTDKFYVEFYFGPASLDSEQIPLSVDGDVWCEAFIMAVRGYIESSRNGRSELLDGPANMGSFRNYWIPKFRNSLASTARNKRSNQFPVREC